jgi:hypothetical protein
MIIREVKPDQAPAPGPFDFAYGGGSGGGAGESSDGEMPESLKIHLLELEAWATANKKDAKNDAIAFWILKVPAILTSVGSGLFAYSRFK